MRRKLKHSLLGMTMVAATVAAPIATNQASAQAGWSGFTTASVPSGLTNGGVNTSPAFTAAVTSDLGGAGTDLWVSNHAERSEAMVDWSANTAGLAVFADALPATGGFDSHGAAFTDVDGDGDDDLIETSGRNHNTRLFKNTAGVISATGAGGLEDLDGRGRTVLMTDIDLDGDMDALIVNLDRTLVPDPGGVGSQPSELYLNNGDGTVWTKVADPNEVINDGSLRYAHLTSTGPGTPQVILTSNSFAFAIDTVKTGSATLVAEPNPVNTTAGLEDNASNLRDIALGDIDGDLVPEWVVARQDDFLQTDVDEDGEPDLLGTLAIGVGNISKSSLVSDDVTDISSDLLADNCRTVALADYDNDADLDIFGGCSMLENGQDRNIVLLNDGAGNFTIAAETLVPATQANTATVAVNADFNDDGWIDTYVGGGYDSQAGEDFIFLNGGGSNNYIKIELDGTNPDMMGAQVFVGTDKWQVRETGHRVHRGQDMREIHFGLGTEMEIAPVEIMWPDGTFERCSVAGINQTVTITKGADTCEAQTKSGLLANLAAAPDMTPVNPPVEPPADILCNDEVVTVNMGLGEMPTEGDDVIRGTAGNDTIDALGGNDIICALQGDDVINGGDGFDKIFAGAGNDTIDGGSGNDLLIGGKGVDTINGGNGNDRIQGGDGDDVLAGDNGQDRINGGNGNDILRGGKFADQLFGNLGRDQLFGDEGNDVLRGGAWKDIMNGGSQTDGCTLTDPGGLVETRINCETGVFGL